MAFDRRAHLNGVVRRVRAEPSEPPADIAQRPAHRELHIGWSVADDECLDLLSLAVVAQEGGGVGALAFHGPDTLAVQLMGLEADEAGVFGAQMLAEQILEMEPTAVVVLEPVLGESEHAPVVRYSEEEDAALGVEKGSNARGVRPRPRRHPGRR